MSISSIATNAFAGSLAGSLTGSSLSTSSTQSASGQSPAQWLMNYAQMTPAQQMRASILAQMGLTEQDLAKMDPKAREKVEDKIKQDIQQQVQQSTEKKTGVIADIRA
jgi:TPP-dependent pyruvate/acetoin dehydrogenase alpha subunit